MNHTHALGFARVVAYAGLSLASLWFAPPAAANERAAMQVCRADALKLCASVQPGGGRVAACLRENESKLSSPCQAQLGKIEVCAAEVKKLCPQAKGEGELRQCLTGKRAELSAECRAAAGG
jgi:Cysteine rich repeat